MLNSPYKSSFIIANELNIHHQWVVFLWVFNFIRLKIQEKHRPTSNCRRHFLLHRYRFGEVTREVNINPIHDSQMVREELKRHNGDNSLEAVNNLRDANRFETFRNIRVALLHQKHFSNRRAHSMSK